MTPSEPWMQVIGTQCPGSRLWSLWDMLRFNSEKFIVLMRNLSEIRGFLMPDEHSEKILSVDNAMRSEASEILGLAGDLGLQMSVKEAERLVHFLQKEIVPGGDTRNRFD